MTFKKSDLKTGMVVEYNNGYQALVLVGEFNTPGHEKQSIMFVEKDDYMLGNQYDENLIYRDECHDLSIKKIYRPKTTSIYDMFEQCDEQTLIWERKPKVDWSKVPVDTKILVSFNEKDWHNRYFAKYEEGFVYAFENGTTSWTNDREPFSWSYAKLAEEEDEK